MAKPKITRTYGPIHFEDLDPHRFEDLIRELIYDYKDWRTIEATGRSGSDDGFDIRAYEKADIASSAENENGEEIEEIHPMEGNLWMIQGKREKEIGPKRLKAILSEIDSKNPPYGYILAASADFSKTSRDVFREELRKKGVMEFYLWGKAELEGMLHLPKNDRILFTFFGISLVSKRRSRATEIRSAVNIKNKLYRCVGTGNDFHQSILIRDLKDTHYPYKDKYSDFIKRPRWKEYTAFSHHPLGLCCNNHKYFAYINTETKEFDFTDMVDLVYREAEDDEDRRNEAERRELVNSVWEFFPRAKQGYFIVDHIVKYEDIAVVDDKGDVLYNFPHLYVDFSGEGGPFAGSWQYLELNEEEIRITDDFKRIKVFPKKFEKAEFGKIYRNKTIAFNPESQKEFREYKINTLYEDNGRYDFLKPKDVILVDNTGEEAEELLIQITYKLHTTVKNYVETMGDNWGIRRAINKQLGRELGDNEEINIYEFRKIYKWQLEKQEGASKGKK